MTSDATKICAGPCGKRKFITGNAFGEPDSNGNVSDICKMCKTKKKKPGNYTVDG